MGPLDEKKLMKAALAYRAADAYQLLLVKRWAPRANELRRLDEFHRTRVAWENASYRSRALVEYARGALLATACGERIPLNLKLHYRLPLGASRDRGLLRVLHLIESIHQEDAHVHRTQAQAHPRRQTRRRSLSQAR